MRRPVERIVPIDQIHIDPSLYPRSKVNWMTILRYKSAMAANAHFPPIRLGIVEEDAEKRLWLVDGRHRLEALRQLGEKYVKAFIHRYKTFGELFADAVRCNIMHGLPLSPYDCARCIDRLKEFGFTREEISKIMMMPLESVGRFEARTIILPNGRKRTLKGIEHRIMKKEGMDAVMRLESDKLSVRSVKNLLEQLLAILTAGAMPVGDKKIRALCERIHALLGEVLGL